MHQNDTLKEQTDGKTGVQYKGKGEKLVTLQQFGGIVGFNKLVAANDIKNCVPDHVFPLWRNSKIYFSNQLEIIVSA